MDKKKVSVIGFFMVVGLITVPTKGLAEESGLDTTSTTSTISTTSTTSMTSTSSESTSISTSSTTESTIDQPVPRIVARTNTGTATVSNQDELEAALNNTNVETINFSTDIAINRYLNISQLDNRKIIIEGNGHTLTSVNNYSIRLSGDGIINVDNLDIYCSTPGDYYLFDANEAGIDFNFSSLKAQKGNGIGLVSTAGDANFIRGVDGGNHFSFSYNSSTDSIGDAFIVAHRFVAIDTDIVSDIGRGLFFNSVGDNSEFRLDQTTFKCDSNSTVSNVYLNDKNGKVSFINHSDVTMNNNNPNANGIDSSGMFWDEQNSDQNTGTKFVADSSKVNLYSKGMSAIVFRGRGSSFTINHSVFNIKGDEYIDGASGKYPTIRYGWYGDGLFELTNQSEMKITKTKGQSAGIRMVEPNNRIIVNGGSKFIVDHQEKNNYDYWNYYQAIEFGSGAKNSQFSIDGQGSYVSLNADTGPAIESVGNMSIELSNQGSFFASGSSSYGTFSFDGSPVNIQLKDGNIFDFKNKKVQGPIVGGINGGTFSLIGSELSLWRKNQTMDSNPTKSFDRLDLNLSGSNFGTFNSSTDPAFKNFYQGISFADFSRISANNSKPVIDKILQPTDADQKIYIHAKVLDGPDEYRDAFPAEVKLEGKVVSADGKIETSFNGETNDVLGTYFDPTTKQNGYAEITLPDDKFLNSGDKIVITRAYRGIPEKPFDADPASLPQAVTAAIVPPSPAKLDVNKVSSIDSELSGKGAPKAVVTISLNGNDTGATTQVNDEGKFSISLPKGMKNGDILQVFLQDRAGLANVPDRPATNTGVGNINPAIQLSYHDKTFPPAVVIPVMGSLNFKSVPDLISFGAHKIVDGPLLLPASAISRDLIVYDDRDADLRTGWQLSLKETAQTMANGAVLKYVNRNGETLVINDSAIVIESNSPSNPVEDNLSDGWKTNKQGLQLELPPSTQKIGKYSGTLEWSLMDVPEVK